MSQVHQLIRDAEQKGASGNPKADAVGVGVSNLHRESIRGVWFFLIAAIGFLALGIFFISRAFN